MTNTDIRALRNSFLEFCQNRHWNSPHAVTLTHRQVRFDNGGRVGLTQLLAQQNLRHFLNVLHMRLRRYGLGRRTRLSCVPIFEGGDVVRKHIHLMLDKPAGIDEIEYAALIQLEWSRTTWGYEHTQVDPCYDSDGWLGYISKLRTKDEFADAIDWTNFN